MSEDCLPCKAAVRYTEQCQRDLLRVDVKLFTRSFERVSDCTITADLGKKRSDSCKKRDSAIQSLQNELDLGERPDAAPVRSQITVLEMDFDLMARNSASCTTTILGEVLRDKRWNELLVDL